MTKSRAEQLRFAIMSRFGQFVADYYAEFVDPTPYDHVYYRDGRRYRLTIARYETVDDTQPMRTRTPLVTEADELEP